MRRIAYDVTAFLTVAVVVMELLLEEPPVVLLFGVASLALVGLAWATESVGHYAGPLVGGITV